MSLHPLHDALHLECHILGLLLRRNHKQHHRTQYFRRLDMIQRSIRRHSLLSLPGDVATLQLMMEQSTHVEAGRKQKPQGVVGDAKRDTSVQALRETVMSALPQVISRIYHAASSLFIELSRGFFVPLCSVALAVISRIRVILMRLGREATMILQQHSFIVPKHVLQHFIALDASSFHKWKREKNYTLKDVTGGLTGSEKDTSSSARSIIPSTVHGSITEQQIQHIRSYPVQENDCIDLALDLDDDKSATQHKDPKSSFKEDDKATDPNEHMLSFVKLKYRMDNKILATESPTHRQTKITRQDSQGRNKDSVVKNKKKKNKILDDIFC